MDKKDVALGSFVEGGVGTLAEPLSVEERMFIVEEKVDMLIKMLTANDIHERKEEYDLPDGEIPEVNKDGIPKNTNLIGSSKGQVYVLTVREDAYYIGNRPFRSLSAAGEAVRGSRVSGWVFWKLPDGRTAKEAYASK